MRENKGKKTYLDWEIHFSWELYCICEGWLNPWIYRDKVQPQWKETP